MATAPPSTTPHDLQPPRPALNLPAATTAAAAATAAAPITSSSFASYTLSPAPSAAQLRHASRFFQSASPAFLFSSPKFRLLPPSALPEVAFLGRSNVGKSSVLNALLHRTGGALAHVSGKPGRTRAMNAFGVGSGGGAGGNGSGGAVKRVYDAEGRERWVGRGALVVLDMPGYGRASREEWGTEIVKYLCGRRQLRKTFLLIDAEHGPKDTDRQLISLLRGNGVAYEVVVSKIDKILLPSAKSGAVAMSRNLGRLPALYEDIRRRLYDREELARASGGVLPDMLTCSAERAWPQGSGCKIGIDNLRWAVLTATGLDCDVDGRRQVIDFEVQAEDEEV